MTSTKTEFERLLTDNEYKEFKRCPPGCGPENRVFTDEQIGIRQAIGAKIESYFLSLETPPSEGMMTIYKKRPMWKFYVNSDTSGPRMPRRVYGVAITDDGEERVHAATAHLGFINDVVGGVPVTDIRTVDRWDDKSLRIIELTSHPEVFLDPLGFLVLIGSVHGCF